MEDFMISQDEIKGVKVLKFKKKIKPTTLQRFLVSKFLYDTKNFGLKHLAALFLNQLVLEDLFRKGEDEELKEWKEDLSKLSTLLKQFNFSNNLTTKGIENFGKRLVGQKFTKLLCQKRNFNDLNAQYDEAFDFVEIKNPIPKKPPKEQKAYISKGYTDKGTKKDPATHGSPSWQEVSKSDKVYPIPGDKDYDKKREIKSISEAIKILKRDIGEIRVRRREERERKILP
jgi:hypothetical protein